MIAVNKNVITMDEMQNVWKEFISSTHRIQQQAVSELMSEDLFLTEAETNNG